MLVLSIYINFIFQYLFVLPSSSITLFTMGAQTASRSGNAAQKNRREFCENDFKIIEAIQSNQMDTESVAIFIDDKFDLVYGKLEVFRFVANRKAFFVKNLMDMAEGTDSLMSGNDKMKNRSTLPNSQNKEINYATTTQQALTLSKTFSMAFILSSVDDITNTFRMMIEQPSLVKIVVNYKECFHNKTMYENGVKNVSQLLWMEHRVLHIYYIPLCLIELNQSTMGMNVAVDDDDDYEYEECFVDDIYVYDAFQLYPKDIRSAGGKLRKFSTLGSESKTNRVYPVNSKQSTNPDYQNVVDVNDDGGVGGDGGGGSGGGGDDVAKSFNDFLQIDGKRFNLHGMAVNVSFFPTTMAYLKAETKLYAQLSTEQHLSDPLSTSPDIYFGVDIEILKEFARKINFTPHVINPSDKQYYGFRQQNGSFTGALGDLLYQRTEFIMNAFFIKDYETRDLQFTSAVYGDEMCVVVRSADLIPEALLILRIFTEQLWILIGVTILMFSAVYFAFVRYLNDIQLFVGNEDRKLRDRTAIEKLKNFIDILVNITGVILTKPFNLIGDTNSERVLLGMCLLYALILTGAFQGCLIQVYTKPFTYPNIETMDALDNSGLWLGIQFNNNVVDLFEDRGDSPLTRMKNKLFFNVEETIFQRVARTGGMAVLERALNEPSQTKKFPRSNGQSLLNFVSECPKAYTLALIVRRNYVLAEVLNDYINHIAQGGLITKWLKDTAFTFDLEYNFHHDRFFVIDDVVLSLRHLEVSFWVLGLGFSIASLVLVGEIIVATYENRTNASGYHRR